MTDPAELCFDDECFNTRYFTSLQHFCIGYFILPCNPSYATQTAHVELIKTAYVVYKAVVITTLLYGCELWITYRRYNLPSYLQQDLSYRQFKEQLKTCLFGIK